jgi:hypothetical protein
MQFTAFCKEQFTASSVLFFSLLHLLVLFHLQNATPSNDAALILPTAKAPARAPFPTAEAPTITPFLTAVAPATTPLPTVEAPVTTRS